MFTNIDFWKETFNFIIQSLIYFNIRWKRTRKKKFNTRWKRTPSRKKMLLFYLCSSFWDDIRSKLIRPSSIWIIPTYFTNKNKTSSYRYTHDAVVSIFIAVVLCIIPSKVPTCRKGASGKLAQFIIQNNINFNEFYVRIVYVWLIIV